MKVRLLSHIAFALILAEVALVLLSWLLSATMTGDTRSLLSSEGIRWFFGHFVGLLESPLLVWLLLLSMAGGCFWQSRLCRSSSVEQPLVRGRRRAALRASVVVLLLYVAVLLALTVVPHALLLSATGQLFPSAFSRALVPVVSFGIILISISYGTLTGTFRNHSDIFDALSWGVGKAAPLFVLFVLLAQFIESLRFVFFY